MAKKENTTSIGFEEIIWRAADKLRGNLSASDYEGVVLGLIFLKYISDKFEEKYEELKNDEYADVEDKDEYEAYGVFFVPQDDRWSVIEDAAHTLEIGIVVDKAFRNGELENEAGFCAVKTIDDIAAQDYILTPGRYVGIAEQEDDGEPFAEKMDRLTSELSNLFAESHRLEDEIRKQLLSIGIGIE